MQFFLAKYHLVAILLACFTGCASFSSGQIIWQIQHSDPAAQKFCSLHSEPIAFSTTAGIDRLIISIDNNNLVSFKMSPENLRLSRPEGINIYVDDGQPITKPSLSADKQKLVFDETKSRRLLEMFSTGKLAYIKLGLPIMNDTSSPRIPLAGFHDALVELRLCNVITNKK